MSTSARYYLIPCEECGGRTRPSLTLPNFSACTRCGKVMIAPDDAELEAEVAEPDDELGADFELPDYMEVVEGWRAWGVPMKRSGAPPRLYSVTFREEFWTPREAQEGICLAKRRGNTNTFVQHAPTKTHEVPDGECNCGLYSAKTKEHLQSMTYHRYDAESKGYFHVMGTVHVWGKVLEGFQGWRSTFAYPKELYVPYEAWRLAEPLAEAYGVPVHLQNILAEGQGKE